MYYIYLIVNKVNGKTYVGQRKSSKECYEDSYMGSGTLLKKAKQKYGIENFEKFLIQYCYSKEETNKAERFWIAEYRSRGKAEYNLANGGDGGSPNKGKHMSEEQKRKISETLKRKNPNKGKHWKCSEETKNKISEANKGRQAWNKGKQMSDEQKKKLSESHKGKKHEPHSDETKRKISEAMKGKRWKLVEGKHINY